MSEPPNHHSDRPSFTGPIENIKPGDILSWERFPEYEQFMREKHGIQKVKHWGFEEKWIDNGQRPFANHSQSAKPPPEEPNPFDE